MRVLLIEDDSATAQSIELMLKSEGFNVYTTDLGEEGVDLGKIYDYDLILLDLNLPDMSGFTLLQQLCRNPDWRTIPVIAVADGDVTPAERESLQGRVRQIVQAGEDALQDELVAELRRIAPPAR